MISDEEKAKIRRLFFAEHWKVGTIASQLNLHPDAVRRAIDSERFNAGRPVCLRQRITDPYLEFIEQTLKQYPSLRATRLHQMLLSRGYQGSVIQLRRVLRTLRPTRREAFFRLRTLPAEEGQADWAHFGEICIGRARRRLSCFVLTLSYSRALYLEFTLDQSIESFLRAHVNAFRWWGGVPRQIKFDNLKSVVVERFHDAVRFHPRLLEFSGHYQFAAVPCRPARGNEKGRVERAIQYIRHSFFAARPFTDLDDFNRQALIWSQEIAHRRPCPGDERRTVAEVFAEERPRLLGLPAHHFDCDLRQPIRSDKTIYVEFDTNAYSIPPSAVGLALTLVANQDLVRILDGTREIARHRRSWDRKQQIDDPAHIAALLEQKRKALGATAGGRLAALLPRIEEFLAAAFERGQAPAHQTKRLLGLLEDYGAQEVSAAIDEALERQTPRVASVALILQQRRRQAGPTPRPVDLSRHPHLADLSVPTPRLEVYDELTDDQQ